MNDPTADVALLTKSFAEVGIQADLFEKVDTGVVTSLGNLYDFAQDKNGYGPCYSVCRYGIMYDAAALKKAGVEMNRKSLSEMAINDPAAFAAVVELAKKAL